MPYSAKGREATKRSLNLFLGYADAAGFSGTLYNIEYNYLARIIIIEGGFILPVRYCIFTDIIYLLDSSKLNDLGHFFQTDSIIFINIKV